jgi:glycosyltransferase involved in cell wall biosynthesis
MFETDTIPDGWTPRLNYMDEIWVPTNFSRDVFVRAGAQASKVKVLGEPVDTEYFQPNGNKSRADTLLETTLSAEKKTAYSDLLPVLSIPDDEFIFLFVGKWETRKGIKLLLRAYYEEFSNYDNVTLVLLTSAYHSESDFEVQIQRYIKDELMTDESFSFALRHSPQAVSSNLNETSAAETNDRLVKDQQHEYTRNCKGEPEMDLNADGDSECSNMSPDIGGAVLSVPAAAGRCRATEDPKCTSPSPSAYSAYPSSLPRHIVITNLPQRLLATLYNSIDVLVRG